MTIALTAKLFFLVVPLWIDWVRRMASEITVRDRVLLNRGTNACNRIVFPESVSPGYGIPAIPGLRQPGSQVRRKIVSRRMRLYGGGNGNGSDTVNPHCCVCCLSATLLYFGSCSGFLCPQTTQCLFSLPLNIFRICQYLSPSTCRYKQRRFAVMST